MECPNCRKEYSNTNNFCPSCGAANPTPQAPVIQPIYVPYAPPPYVGMFIASMVLGIVSIWMYPVGLITGALAIIFYVEGKRRLNQNPMLRGKGMGTAGLVTGIIGASICTIFWMVILIASTVSRSRY